MDRDAAHSLTLVEGVLWVVTKPTGVGRYDFPFEQFFACRHPVYREGVVRAVARMGATGEYDQRYTALRAEGIELVHSPEEYRRTSHLPGWYPLIEDLTARSVWFDRRPSVAEVEARFRWPVFVKGERQTSRHERKLSIIEGPAEFQRLMDFWEADPVLRWQQVVCREYLQLRLVGEQAPGVMPRAFEFRTFWWGTECVGVGPYWVDDRYELSEREKSDALALAGEVARRVGVAFLVVDVAQCADGRWVAIECNDGQDAGYAGVAPMLLWRRVLDLMGMGEGGGQ